LPRPEPKRFRLGANGAAAEQTVGAHAGEYNRQYAGAINGGGRAKERIGSGAAVIFKRSLVEVEGWRLAGTRGRQHLHVPVAARDGDSPGAHRVALRGFTDAQAAAAVETTGKDPGKQLRHMLHDKYRQREAGRKRGSRTSSAAGPPVETPMARTAGVDEMGCVLDPGGTISAMGKREGQGEVGRGNDREEAVRA